MNRASVGSKTTSDAASFTLTMVRRGWQWSRSLRRRVTSISDDTVYPQICSDAATNERVFRTFRRQREYRYVLGQLSRNHGEQYLERIRRFPELRESLIEFRDNDLHGGPIRFEFGSAGEWDPTTLRYVLVAGQLTERFGPLDGLRVCEIGVGYGGQCRVLDAFARIAKYTLVDLAQPLALTRRYLQCFPIRTHVDFRTLPELDPEAAYDLCISNYAFSELPGPLQDVYLNKVIQRSQRGFMICNQITPPEFLSHGKRHLLELIPGARTVPEDPLTHPLNYTLLWGDRGEDFRTP